MTFTDRKFGVEIEYTGVSRTTVRSILNEHGYITDQQGRSRNLEQWSVVFDGSVTGAGNEYDNTGGEVVSPILSGEAGLEAIGKVSRLISRNGGKADRSCGLHVHVDATGIPIPELHTIARRYARFESEIDSFMPRSRRGNGNNYCYSMTPDVLTRIDQTYNRDSFYNVDRYRKLNLNSVYKHGTIEFRQHGGSINPEKIKNWVRFCVSFVEESRIIHKQMMEQFEIEQAEARSAAAALRATRTVTTFNPAPSWGIASDYVTTTIEAVPPAPQLPPGYPLRRGYSDNIITINNREQLSNAYFRYISYSERGGLANQTLEHVRNRLINGFDINNDQVYTYSPGTVRRAMSALRNMGYIITHRRGTGRYILAAEQPRAIFSAVVNNLLFHGGEIPATPQTPAANISKKYDVTIADALFRGMDADIVAFYNERATDFADR